MNHHNGTDKLPAGKKTVERAPINAELNPELSNLAKTHGLTSTSFIRAAASSVGNVENCIPQSQTYWNINPSSFNVRTKGYKRHKKKAPSSPALYDLIAMDITRSDELLMDVSEKFDIPDDFVKDRETGLDYVPSLFVVNALVPLDEPQMFGNASKKDRKEERVMAILYLGITEYTLEQLKDLDNASPAVKIFAEFCRRGDDDPEFRNRLKIMVLADSLEEMKLPGFLAKFNGKPCLINKKTGTFTQRRTAHSGLKYAEMNINLNAWRFVSRKGIHAVLPFICKAKFQLAITIEGREDDELPEILLGGCRMFDFDFRQAVRI